MTRDDSSGGWVPDSGGGLSYVCLKKIPMGNGEDQRKEYIIYGEKIADESVVLNCVIRKDIRYTKANPKFHHWQTDDKRFGLTFERSDDAKAFDRGIKQALAELTEGSVGSSGLDDDVFEPLDLPMGWKDSSSQSASTTSTTTSSPAPRSPVSPSQDFAHPNSHHLHRIHYVITHTKPVSPQSDNSSKSDSVESSGFGRDDIKDEPTSISGKSEVGLLESDTVGMLDKYSYVVFAKPKNHDYSYPNLEPVQKAAGKVEPLRHTVISAHPPLPTKSKKKKDVRKSERQSNRLLRQMSRCKYCQETFSHDENHRGSCEYSPDRVKDCIQCMTCVGCASGVIYHCMSDAEGEFGHPCACDFNDDSNCKKWTVLTILSFFLPCLWCYWPLTACHYCGKRCGCCGGRHFAA